MSYKVFEEILSTTVLDPNTKIPTWSASFDMEEIASVWEYDDNTSLLLLKSGLTYYIQLSYLDTMAKWQKYRKG